MRRTLTLSISLVFALSLGACGDDDPTGVDGDLFVGTWVATSMIFSPDAGGNPIDVVPFGAALTVTVDQDLDVIWSFTTPGQGTEQQDATLTVNESTSTVTVDFNDPEEEDIIATYAFSGGNDTLTLTADDVAFDINQDGEPEPGSFQVVMQRQ